ncbi:Ribonuclease H-like superfamily protein [Striga hermonthica]|uniref:Ribonuclease H-like superfamily protein n=1 Tax=Striga hermonthica TaxID=68872 RepID=A0A9N7P2Z0_STRHE|nr:Ribonuclease H-like superfamily protein [Striga hermonthica]
MLLEVLHKYQLFTGQKVNLHKSSLFLSKNGSASLSARLSAILNGVQIKRSSKYLGLPLGIGASKIENFQFVVEVVRERICSWKNHFLSTAGKEVLVKHVLSALPVFVMSCFVIPISVCKEVCRLMARFWWQKGDNNGKGMHWLSWDNLAIPKDEGGLGFKDLQLFRFQMNKLKLEKDLSDSRRMRGKGIDRERS